MELMVPYNNYVVLFSLKSEPRLPGHPVNFIAVWGGDLKFSHQEHSLNTLNTTFHKPT